MLKYLLSVTLCFFVTQSVTAQYAAVIRLSDERTEYTPKNYYIQDVKDYRQSQDGIGRINEGSIDLESGLVKALVDFLPAKANTNNALPVIMRINRFQVTEKTAGSKRQFELALGIAYYSGNSKLVEYNGSSFAQSGGEADSYIAKMIRENMTNNLKQFDDWMAKNKQTIAAQPEVNVAVHFARTSDNPDQIAYSKSRKLVIPDFEGAPDNNIVGAAATLSGIGMNYQSSTLRNKTNVNVTLSVYFTKSRSWMKDGGKNTSTLIHEQRHFDITAIKACLLKKWIEETTFTPEHYKQQLKDLLDKAQDEGADMQNTYDDETEHGTITGQQEAWNKKIDELLSQQNCY